VYAINRLAHRGDWVNSSQDNASTSVANDVALESIMAERHWGDSDVSRSMKIKSRVSTGSATRLV
jgi:hypothetical protein